MQHGNVGCIGWRRNGGIFHRGGGGNSIVIPNATSNYDFGDGAASTAAGYGSFQVHNHGASQTILSYAGFGSAQADGLGIGNNTGVGELDYTFAGNATSYTVKNLQILVLPGGLLANDTDADGDPLTITAADTVAPTPTGGTQFAFTSAQGAAVTV